MKHMEFAIKIMFGKSTSKQYEETLQLAAQLTQFTPADDERPNRATITHETISDDLKLISDLWQQIKGWKSTRLIIDGDPIAKKDFNDLLIPLNCNLQQKKAMIQKEYCSIDRYIPGWGCKHQDVIVAPSSFDNCILWPKKRFWYQVGEFFNDHTWQVDKAQIRMIFNREAQEKRLYLCPMFDLKKTQDAIDMLPDFIDLNEMEGWEIDQLEFPGLSPQIIGVKPKDRNEQIRIDTDFGY